MATQRKRATTADECAILGLVGQKAWSVRSLAEEVGLPQKEVRRVLEVYRREGIVHQLWALTPLATADDGIPVEIKSRQAVPLTLFLPFPEEVVA
jgi:hypothetical protein